jgi:hypothetical protein
MVFVNSFIYTLKISSSSNVIENKLPTILHTHPSYICIGIRICHYFPDSSKVPFAHAKTLYQSINQVKNKLKRTTLFIIKLT